MAEQKYSPVDGRCETYHTDGEIKLSWRPAQPALTCNACAARMAGRQPVPANLAGDHAFAPLLIKETKMKTLESLEANAVSRSNQELIKNLLDLVANDSENLERTMQYMSDDCIWIMEPGRSEYHGVKEIRAFVDAAMQGRTHDSEHKIEILNWFASTDWLCIEYTHGAKSSGKTFTGGVKLDVKTGVLRYCITYRMRNGKISEVHEYINATSRLYNTLLPTFLGRLYRKARKSFA